MSVTFTHLLEEALLPAPESRTELIVALLERTEPSKEFLEQHLGIVSARMQRVQQGASTVTDAEKAHDQVLHSLQVHS